jgi:hypothetical protein
MLYIENIKREDLGQENKFMVLEPCNITQDTG